MWTGGDKIGISSQTAPENEGSVLRGDLKSSRGFPAELDAPREVNAPACGCRGGGQREARQRGDKWDGYGCPRGSGVQP